MKITNRKFLVAGLLASALTFVGCKSTSSAEQTGTTDTTQTPATDTGTDTTGTGTGTDTTGTGTTPETPPGTGGSGNISKTKQSDDNLRMPQDDSLRTRDDDTIRESESEQGVHENSAVDPESGTGGSGLDNQDVDDNLNDGGNIDERRTPASPEDVTPDGVTEDSSQLPEGTR